MKRPFQEQIFLLLLAQCFFLFSCGEPDNSSAGEADVSTSLNEEVSINLEKKSEDSLEKKPAKSLEEAVVEGDFEVVRAYIEAGTDLNRAVAENGSTALVMAVTFDHTEISLLLIESGADLEVKIDDGSTVLHAAAFYGRVVIDRA
jgi:ankyrin repeat protein